MNKRSLRVRNNKGKLKQQNPSNSLGLHAEQHEVEISELFNPFPEPEELERFAKIMPDAANRLFAFVEKEQQFRHDSYKQKMDIVQSEVRTDNIVRKLGMSFAFVIFMFSLGISGYLIYSDKAITGSIFMGLTLISGIGMFISNKRSEEKNNKKEI